MYGYGHFPNISPVGAPPHIGPITTCCRPICPPVTGCVGVGIIAIATLILIALGVIF
ncbi:hypothetical protein DEAC_c38920 [Desulfosporosinus acididurans]|uniref:Uncharacterized protein n=1 Tax=Desulfosporosinus acididurans TaxID=476652 RepID=A0A0J1FL67_9FIRM|nr:hypothetical protein [Desulfosporosinus acididurans]KLU64259.1 hypothetical protein DEAC_c38920 [Desulfosporosinus acididurans]